MHRAGFGFQTLEKYFTALIASRLPGIVRKRKRAFKPDAPEPEQMHRPVD
jgi:hypothetical protein